MAFFFYENFLLQKFFHLGLVPGFATGVLLADHIKTIGTTTSGIYYMCHIWYSVKEAKRGQILKYFRHAF
jgi:hypothetical protein